MKYCSNCILSENIFSVTIGEDGLCNYCSACVAQSAVRNESQKIDLHQFEHKTEYDVLLAYSGGKDSTYALFLLKEKYHLNVLAVTFDNGFLAKETYKNIKKVCLNLDVDNLIVSPSVRKLRTIFRYSNLDETIPQKSLERASAICTYCIGLVKMNVYKEAIMRGIPFIAFGWTPGQASMNKQTVQLSYQMIKSNFSRMKDNIIKEFGDSYRSLLLNEDVLEQGKDNMPSLFYPFDDTNYSENKIIETIERIGWSKPNDTDGNSTNCLLNTFAIHQHQEKYGFHPYATELAYLVRNNLMKRGEAIKRVTQCENVNILNYVEKKLNEN